MRRGWFLWLALVGLGVSILPLAGFPTTAQETNWSAIIEQVKPAVVWILVTTPEGGGSGSGFIINPDGYILTAAHVVEDAYDITVIVEEEKEYDARVVESDEDADVALLKISATGLKSVILSDSDEMDYDDEIRVFGYPLPQAGAGLIVTAGTVQGFRRRDGVKLIQISAPINPGNSGGPLINADGEAMGMVSEFWSALTGFGLAVAINTAKSFIPPGILPRVLHVPQGFSTIQSAIDAARSGDIILIGTGTYHENDIQITKSVTLRGAGREQTIIEGDGDKQIKVEGTGITVLIEHLALANFRTGISVYASARVTITSCTVSKNEEDGIVIGGSAQAEITDSTISENKVAGILLWDSAQAKITDSTVSENKVAGIFIWDSTQVMITDSTISENGDYGIGLGDSAHAEITGSTISKNELAGIVLRVSAQAEITGSTISENGSYGIGLWDSAHAEITGSTISKNVAGIVLRVSAQAEITGSTISENGECGILLWGSTQIMITDSTISENEDYGIGLEDSARAEITGSTISKNEVAGIVLRVSAQAKITGSTISKNGDYGIGLWDSAQVMITDSTISENGDYGIFLADSVQAQITGSTISKNMAGIVLRVSAQAEITSSTISNGVAGIFLADSAQATIKGNTIVNNWSYGVALLQQPCYDTDEVFTGHVSGSANIIPGPGEPDGNQKGAVCPSELEFLMTEEGGEYP